MLFEEATAESNPRTSPSCKFVIVTEADAMVAPVSASLNVKLENGVAAVPSSS